MALYKNKHRDLHTSQGTMASVACCDHNNGVLLSKEFGVSHTLLVLGDGSLVAWGFRGMVYEVFGAVLPAVSVRADHTWSSLEKPLVNNWP